MRISYFSFAKEVRMLLIYLGVLIFSKVYNNIFSKQYNISYQCYNLPLKNVTVTLTYARYITFTLLNRHNIDVMLSIIGIY